MTEQNSAMSNKPGGEWKGDRRKPGETHNGQTRMFRQARVCCKALPETPESEASRLIYGCALDDQKKSQYLDGLLKGSFLEHRLIEFMVALGDIAHSKGADFSSSGVTDPLTKLCVGQQGQ